MAAVTFALAKPLEGPMVCHSQRPRAGMTPMPHSMRIANSDLFMSSPLLASALLAG
jgi:hypothetical protein